MDKIKKQNFIESNYLILYHMLLFIFFLLAHELIGSFPNPENMHRPSSMNFDVPKDEDRDFNQTTASYFKEQFNDVKRTTLQAIAYVVAETIEDQTKKPTLRLTNTSHANKELAISGNNQAMATAKQLMINPEFCNLVFEKASPYLESIFQGIINGKQEKIQKLQGMLSDQGRAKLLHLDQELNNFFYYIEKVIFPGIFNAFQQNPSQYLEINIQKLTTLKNKLAEYKEASNGSLDLNKRLKSQETTILNLREKIKTLENKLNEPQKQTEKNKYLESLINEQENNSRPWLQIESQQEFHNSMDTAKITVLEKEKRQLQLQCQTKENDLCTLQMNHSKLEDEHATLKMLNQGLESQNQELMTLQKINQTLQIELEEKVKQLSTLPPDNREIIDSGNKACDSLQTLQTNYKALAENLKAKDIEIEQLKKSLSSINKESSQSRQTNPIPQTPSNFTQKKPKPNRFIELLGQFTKYLPFLYHYSILAIGTSLTYWTWISTTKNIRKLFS